MSIVAHRGVVDVVDETFDSPAGLVHFRQVDPVTAHRSSHRRIVFDGDLYDRRGLAMLLGAESDASDAEVVLAAFDRWGPACLDRLIGKFAFVIWDDVAKRLHAVRDRFGQKPLYLCAHAAGVAFASEMKQLLELPAMRARLDLEMAFDFLHHGLTDHEVRTMMAGILRLPAGSRLEFDLAAWRPGAALPSSKTWYALPEPDTLDLDEPTAVEELRGRLFEAVRSQWQRPGAKAICVSGGLDSCAIAAIVAQLESWREPREEIRAFKACFDDPLYDEAVLYESVLAATGVKGLACRTSALDPFRVLDPLVWHMDEPFARAALAAQWMLFELAASRGTEFTLDGQGADEQLGGYMSMVHAHKAHVAGDALSATAVSSSRANLGEGGVGIGDSVWVAPGCRSVAARQPPGASGRSRGMGELCRERMMHGDLPIMMRHNDRIGAAHGIETHVPFLDHRVVEFTIALGGRYKLEGDRTKYVLRRAMEGLVPRPVLDHPYKGSYSALEASWLRGKGRVPLRAGVLATIHEWPELFSAAGVSALCADIAAASKETLMLLWRIACFGAWARRFDVML
jgi:asparagine synthase (glutamine-hydrolysing)